MFSAIRTAVLASYRMIDTAHVYENEVVVGESIDSLIKKGEIVREDRFVIDKLWNSAHRPDLVRPACERSLRSVNRRYLKTEGHCQCEGQNRRFDFDSLSDPARTLSHCQVGYARTNRFQL